MKFFSLIKQTPGIIRGNIGGNIGFHRSNSTYNRPLTLGIETSCDDTGAAIVDGNGTVLGESICSQQKTHLMYGGIIPTIAQDMHRKNIENVVNETIAKSNLNISQLDAIAVTNRPGLPMSLKVGVRYAKHLGRKHSIPLIPIHHMEAHALTVRLQNKITYPFLTILCSGGHCLLALVKSYNQFYLLGETLDDAPGEALDKIARRLQLRNMPEYTWLSGGAAIEKAAQESRDSSAYEFPLPLARQRDCMFSFSGMKNTAMRYIKRDEMELCLGPDDVIPQYQDFCLGFLKGITRHIVHRTQRAIEFCENEGLLTTVEESQKKFLVLSGGCASNDFLFTALTQMAMQFGVETVRPPKRYCTDNGVMIAWNGVERFLQDGATMDFDSIGIESRCPFGETLKGKIEKASIGCKWAKVEILKQYS